MDGIDQDKLVEELKERMSNVELLPGDDFFTRTDTLLRFLKARSWNVDDAEKQLKDTVEWRRQTNPLNVDCRWCHERPGYHCVRQVGIDKQQRPVIYACFAQAASKNTTVEDVVIHMAQLIESAKKTMGPTASTWVFIMDCTGMTLTACNPRVGYGITSSMATYYPERLGLVICIHHSPVFQGVWNAFKVFLDPNTAAKMQLLRKKSKFREAFQRLFSEELADWLMDEVKLNKQRPFPPTQRQFWKGLDPEAAKSPPVTPTTKFKSLTSRSSAELLSKLISRHDPRGCPSYVRQHIEPYLDDCEKHEHSTIHHPHPNIVDALRGTVADVDCVPAATEDGVVPNGSTASLSEAAAVTAEVSSYNSEDEDSQSDNSSPSINISDLSEEFQIPQHVVEEYEKRHQQQDKL